MFINPVKKNDSRELENKNVSVIRREKDSGCTGIDFHLQLYFIISLHAHNAKNTPHGPFWTIIIADKIYFNLWPYSHHWGEASFSFY